MTDDELLPCPRCGGEREDALGPCAACRAQLRKTSKLVQTKEQKKQTASASQRAHDRRGGSGL